MKSLKRQLLFFALGICATMVWGQKSMQDSSITFPYLSIVYGGAMPGGDLADRFGYTSEIGGDLGLKLRNSFYFSAGARFLFGGDVREEIATNLTELRGGTNNSVTPMALGGDGRWYEVRFYERGLTIPVKIGYIIPFLNPNPNSGFYVEAGAQYIHHKVRIEVPGNSVPGLFGSYTKGYDRYTNGLGLLQGFGYRLHNNNRLINFSLGFQVSQNFTQGRRDVQFDTGLPDRADRLDLLVGFKAAWIFPLYRSAPDDLYYY
jgi:hypothetical protein